VTNWFAGVVETDKADAIVKLNQTLVDGRTPDTVRQKGRAVSGAGRGGGRGEVG
jgi:hypothetical protein